MLIIRNNYQYILYHTPNYSALSELSHYGIYYSTKLDNLWKCFLKIIIGIIVINEIPDSACDDILGVFNEKIICDFGFLRIQIFHIDKSIIRLVL